jgi:hypothetical protein
MLVRVCMGSSAFDCKKLLGDASCGG